MSADVIDLHGRRPSPGPDGRGTYTDRQFAMCMLHDAAAAASKDEIAIAFYCACVAASTLQHIARAAHTISRAPSEPTAG